MQRTKVPERPKGGGAETTQQESERQMGGFAGERIGGGETRRKSILCIQYLIVEDLGQGFLLSGGDLAGVLPHALQEQESISLGIQGETHPDLQPGSAEAGLHRCIGSWSGPSSSVALVESPSTLLSMRQKYTVIPKSCCRTPR